MKTPLGYDCQSVPHITVNLSKCFYGFEQGEGGREGGDAKHHNGCILLFTHKQKQCSVNQDNTLGKTNL